MLTVKKSLREEAGHTQYHLSGRLTWNWVWQTLSIVRIGPKSSICKSGTEVKEDGRWSLLKHPKCTLRQAYQLKFHWNEKSKIWKNIWSIVTAKVYSKEWRQEWHRERWQRQQRQKRCHTQTTSVCARVWNKHLCRLKIAERHFLITVNACVHPWPWIPDVV